MRLPILPLLAAGALALAAAPASGDEIPTRKSGLWEIRTQAAAAGRMPPHTVQLCIDQKTDDAVQGAARGAAKELCSRNDIRRDGDRMVVDSVCKFGETTATTHSVFTGRFDSAYRVETTSTYDPPLAGMKEGSAVIEAKWLGRCKPDQKPGDMILSNGMKININNAPGMSPPAPSAPPKQ